MKILQITGGDNGWGVVNRAEHLRRVLHENGAEMELVPYGKPSKPFSTYDIIHIQTLSLVRHFIHVPELYRHPCWGFEVVSERSLKHLATSKRIIPLAKWSVVKNPRLQSKILPLFKGHCLYIPNGVDTKIFKPRPILLGWVGNKSALSLLKYKGVYIVQEAVRQLNLEWKSYGLHVEFMLDPSDYPKKVYGSSDIAQFYQCLDAYVSASHAEGCSNVTLEALATGLPVLTTETGIIPELVDKLPLTVVPRKVVGVLEGLKRMFDPILQRRKLMMGSYDWDTIAARYLHLYRSII